MCPLGSLPLLISLITFNAWAADTFPGQCLEFDGVDDYAQVDVLAGAMTGHETGFSISGWFHLDHEIIDARETLIAVNTASGGNVLVIWARSTEGNTAWLDVYDGGSGSHEIHGPELEAGRWYHLGYTRDGGTGRLYLDGSLGGEHTADYTFASDDRWSSGQEWDSGPVPSDFLEGKLDELQLWQQALDVQQLRELQHLTLFGDESGLLAYWQCNEGSGNLASDAVGTYDAQLVSTGWSPSDAPLGGGGSLTQIITAAGRYDFSPLGVVLDYSSFTGGDTVVVSRLDLEPNQLPGIHDDFDTQYWILRRFGDASFTTDLLLTPAETIEAQDEALPSHLLLYSRDSNATGAWTHQENAAAASAMDNEVRFEGLSDFSQFMISRDPLPWLLSTSPADNATNVSPDLSLQLDFDQPVFAESGGIELYRAADDSLIADLPASGMSYDGTQVTADPDVQLELQTTYYMLVDADAFQNAGGHFFAGIANPSSWIFTSLPWFTDIEAGLEGVYDGSAQWGDFDNDGDLDILLAGDVGGAGEGYSGVYRNGGGGFVEIDAGLEDLYSSSAQWGDYDNDGDLDVLHSGFSPTGPVTRLYRNSGGSLSDIGAGLPGVSNGSAQWGDVDNDGDLDILLTGQSDGGRISRIYRNDAGSFQDVGAGLPGVSNGSAQWGDVDNDGDLDILLAGSAGGTDISRIYRNDAGSFEELVAGLPGVSNSSAQWGDVDNDGDLDVLLTGEDDGGLSIARIYRNNSLITNTPPLASANINLLTAPDSLILSWTPATDAETPSSGLSYNLRIGSPDHPGHLISGMVDEASGWRRIPALGNVQQVTQWTMIPPAFPETLYPHESRTILTAVQAVDHAWAGGAWVETTVDLNPGIEYLGLFNNAVMSPQDILNWDLRQIDDPAGYELQVDTQPDFETPLLQQWIPFADPDLVRENAFGIHLTDLDSLHLIQQDILHYWRVRPIYNDPLRYTVFSETPGEFILVEPPDPPQSFTISVVDEVVTLNWDPVPGDFVYYIVYSSTEGLAPFPEGWQAESPPTTETTWQDPEPATGRKFYLVKAVIVE